MLPWHLEGSVPQLQGVTVVAAYDGGDWAGSWLGRQCRRLLQQRPTLAAASCRREGAVAACAGVGPAMIAPSSPAAHAVAFCERSLEASCGGRGMSLGMGRGANGFAVLAPCGEAAMLVPSGCSHAGVCACATADSGTAIAAADVATGGHRASWAQHSALPSPPRQQACQYQHEATGPAIA